MSTSRTQEASLAGVTRGTEVGVDIELLDKSLDHREGTERFLAPGPLAAALFRSGRVAEEARRWSVPDLRGHWPGFVVALAVQGSSCTVAFHERARG